MEPLWRWSVPAASAWLRVLLHQREGDLIFGIHTLLHRQTPEGAGFFRVFTLALESAQRGDGNLILSEQPSAWHFKPLARGDSHKIALIRQSCGVR